MTEKRKYDSTVARIAGNIASGMAANWNPRVLLEDLDGRNEMAGVCVALARAIVAETERTEPPVAPLPEVKK